MNGVPPEIIQRAENLILISMRGEDLVAACCQMPEDEAAELEEAVSKHIRSMIASNLNEGANSERLSRSGRVS
jgi:DNA mismatch repair protein MSH5